MARRRLEDWLDALRAVDPSDSAGRALLVEALAKGPAPAVARAATKIREGQVEGLFRALEAAYDRLFDKPVKRDPGCTAKLAILDALDEAGTLDPAPFWQGARYRQPEPSWGPPVDTATAVRSRCAAALVRLREPGALDLLADHLADPEVVVRVHAAETLAAWGSDGAAALLRLKIRLGDEEDEVSEAALGSLLAIAPEAGLQLGVELLGSPSSRMRQLAGLALGASRLPGAVAPLAAWLDGAGGRAERQAALVSLGLLRLPAANDRLLEVIAGGPGPDAHAALEALAIQRSDPAVVTAVHAAAARNGHDLSAAIERWFGA